MSGDRFRWSSSIMTIQEAVTRETLPIMVKVEEGIYGDNEADTFSQDDILKLDCVKHIRTVTARTIETTFSRERNASLEKETGYLQSNILKSIPFHYQGTLRIDTKGVGQKVYNSVKELVKDFPRYIKVISDIRDKHGRIVSAKSTLEIERVVPGIGLLCYCDKVRVTLDLESSCKFLLLPDTNEYTIQEVIDKFPLPQSVTFLESGYPRLVTENIQEAIENSNIYTGAYTLIRFNNQNVIIGHVKPYHKSATSQRNITVKRSMVIIPFDCETARGLEIRTLLEADESIYQLKMTKNFSQKNIEKEEDLDGTVYMYFDTTLKNVVFIPEKDLSKEEMAPPPVPRRSHHVLYTRHSDKADQLKSVTQNLQTDEAVEKPPPLPRRLYTTQAVSQSQPPNKANKKCYSGVTNRPTKHPPSKPPKQESYDECFFQEENVYEVSDEDIPDYDEISDVTESRSLTDDEKSRGYVTVDMSARAIIERLPETFKLGLKKVHSELLKKLSPRKKISASFRNDEHKYKDDKTPYKKANEVDSWTDNHPEKLPNDLEKPESEKPFQSLTTKELRTLLQSCQLTKLASICNTNGIDGKFIMHVSDEDLKNSFEQNSLQILKFTKIRAGWRPKT